MQRFPIRIVYKVRIQNRVDDALSRIVYKVGFNCLKVLLNEHDGGFWWNMREMSKPAHDDFHIHHEFLIRGDQLCIPWFSLQEKMIRGYT
jgi:hypothetical protein